MYFSVLRYARHVKLANEELHRLLIENAIDFIDRAIDEIRLRSGATEHENKFAALFLASGIEVMVKARLAQEHWILVFEDPSRATLGRFQSGDFVSVSAGKVIQRLNDVTGVRIDPDQAKRVFDLRNRLVHFAPSPTGNASRVILAGGLSFVASFLFEHLRPRSPADQQHYIEAAQARIMDAYQELKDFADKRMLLLKGELMQQAVVVECPNCSKMALVTDVEGSTMSPQCLFCYFTGSGPEVAEAYAEQVLHLSAYEAIKDGGEDPVRDCPECDENSLVPGAAVANRPKIDYLCFSCSTTYEHDELIDCERCGALIPALDDDWSVCSICSRNMML